MSKGEIVSHIGSGLYNVRLKYSVERVKDELENINARIAELAALIPAKKLEVLQKSAEIDSFAHQVDLLIPDYRAGVEGAAQEIESLQKVLSRLRGEFSRLDYQREIFVAENLSLLKRRGQLERIPEEKTISAWCADLTTDLTGEVGLADINDEGDQGVIIQPGYYGEAPWQAARDGSLMAREAQSGPQAWLNAALLPGVQKWRPRYRVGTITAINSDSCNIALDEAKSSAQGLSINQSSELSGVPILYMDCNGAAFKVSDRVIVRLTDNSPLVVGFEKEPEPCSLFGFVFEPAKWNGVEGPNLRARRIIYGEPFEDANGQINPPLGTPDSNNNQNNNENNNAWTAIPNDGALTIRRGNSRNYGNKNWFNEQKLVLSWDGPPGRAHAMKDIGLSQGQFRTDWRTRPYVYHQLSILLDLNAHPEADSFIHVFGAAIYGPPEGSRWLIVIASDSRFVGSENHDIVSPQAFKVFRIAIDKNIQTIGSLEFLHEVTLPIGMVYQSHFYFSETGTKAVCTIIGDLENPDDLHIDLLRYDIDSGFSVEQIWSRAVSIGTDVTRFSYLYYEREDTGERGSRRFKYYELKTRQYKLPIYCDYVGNREVIAYESHPARTEINESFAGYREPANQPGEYTETEIINHDQQGNFSIVTSENKTLFQMPYRPYYYKLLSYDTVYPYEVSGEYDPGYYKVNNSESVRVGGIDYSEGILSIDIRFEFCAVVHGGYQFDKTESVDTDYSSPDFDDSFVESVGSVNGDRYIDTVEIWQAGSPLKKIDAFDIPKNTKLRSYTHPFGGLVAGGPNYETSDPALPRLPLKVGSADLLTAEAYINGPHLIASFGINYRTENHQERAPIIFTKVSGYSDPIGQIIERSESDGYLLSRVGLI